MNQIANPVNLILAVNAADLLKIFLPPILSFMFGILVTPLLTNVMIRFNLQKVRNVKKTVDGQSATLSAKIHNDEGKVLYRMGGLVVLFGLFATLALLRILPVLFDSDLIAKLNFLSRSQTWMPLAALVIGMIVGGIDDLMVCGRMKRFAHYVGDGLSLRVRLGVALIIALVAAWWMTARLEFNTLYIPFIGTFNVSWIVLSLIIVVAIMVTYAGSVIDGLDGLSGGIFSIMFTTFGLIAFMQQRFDLAAFCFAIVGALLAFLWFNIPPARFMLSDVGSMPLTIVLAIVAVLTDSVLVLPIISFPLVSAIGSVFLQLLSKKIRGKKLIPISPIHNTFVYIGWPAPKVVMRYWIISAMFSTLGLLVFVAGGYF